MGLYDALTGSNSNSEETSKSSGIAHYGGHAMTTANALDPGGNLITPMSPINWADRDYIPVPDRPVLATVAEADRAEDEARRYEIGVVNGIRSMGATEARLEQFSKLERAYCKMLAKAGKTGTEVLAARAGLAHALQEERPTLARLGFSVDRKIERMDNEVELLAAEYGRA